MLDRVLLDDEHFRVSMGLLGAVTVLVKHRSLSRKAPSEYATHLKQTIDELQRRGVPIRPDSPILMELLTDFAEALFAPHGGGYWSTAFGKLPADRAAELIQENT
ncbi:hypothetical protein NKH93_06700 [Mesorhizobium sp. M0954]|uniref:hypothetical protein n=1 Tax=unclassified Mesorhizobium TaxID=325217 RepID=UPI00333E0870